jgi:hypothetical protein
MSIRISVVRPIAALDRSWNYLQQAGAAQVGSQAAGAAQEASTGAQQVGSGAQQEDL